MKIRTAQTLDSVYEGEHLVQLYDNEAALDENLHKFIGGGMLNGDDCVVIATPAHIKRLELLLEQKGFDIKAAKQQKKYFAFDATILLDQFMVNRLPDKNRFQEVIGGLMDGLSGSKSIRAFGEMVALLWQQDNQTAAILLEQFWNELAHDYHFTLFCAYPHYHFENVAQASLLQEISRLHSSLITPKHSTESQYQPNLNPEPLAA